MDRMELITNYLGMSLKSPIVVSACTLSEDLSNIRKMEDNGAGAIVLFSLFEEQIKKEMDLFSSMQHKTSNLFAEGSDFFPELDEYHVGSERYLNLIKQAKKTVDIPIIGSLNGITEEGWLDFAKQIEVAGADALELNIFYIPADIKLTAEDVEQRYLNVLQKVKKVIKIPVAVKLNPFFSSTGHLVSRLEQAGADGLVLFNRFYQPDIDINNLKLLANLAYSDSSEIRLPLMWIGFLFGKIKASLAATSGVQSSREVIKYLLAGADVVMTASALYKHGIEYIKIMNIELEQWMDRQNFSSIQSFKGSLSQQHISNPSAYERANYIKILESKK